MRVYEVLCDVRVHEHDVWNYLEEQGEDIAELKESGYKLTDDDWESTARQMFEDDDFTYYDFVKKR